MNLPSWIVTAFTVDPRASIVTILPLVNRRSRAFAHGSIGARVWLRSVASEVYATGFERDTVVADASRFSGKAITFLPVARFETN